MRVLFVLDTLYHFAYHESTIGALCARGHAVHLLFDPANPTVSDGQAARRFAAGTAALRIGPLHRSGGWRRAVLMRSREVLNYASYFGREDQSDFYRDRWHNRVTRPARWLARSAAGRALLAGPFRSPLRWIERSIAADPGIVARLRQESPDVLAASPADLYQSEEIEYVKAANAIGIPSVLPVLTWDNLTTKGLIHAAPKVLLVWSQTQAHEACTVHRIAPERIVVTGSPLFDKWFQASRLRTDRQAFCRRVGLDGDRPFLAYLGSSKAIAEDESWLVRELLASLRAQDDPALRDMGVLVRPHPKHARIYEPLRAEGVAVWPPRGQLPDSDEAIGDYYNTLHHCLAAVGVNTTGMLDSVIVDKPTVTVLADRYRQTQSQAAHFSHLLAADVLELTHSSSECIARIGELAQGRDARGPLRRRFVESFIRPRGLGRPAGDVVAEAMELAAAGLDAPTIDAKLQHASSS